ncbi:MAG: hypothetical protein RBR24_07480 [Candidatus Carbobacillus sp.]|nr:hypothetical protein [Candidatus Carbobacillus sp.]
MRHQRVRRKRLFSEQTYGADKPSYRLRFSFALELALVGSLFWASLSYVLHVFKFSRLTFLDFATMLHIRVQTHWEGALVSWLILFMLFFVVSYGYAWTLGHISRPYPSLIVGFVLWALVIGWTYPDTLTRLTTLSEFLLAALFIGSSIAHTLHVSKRS